ncbi:lupus La protein [Venturia nashicola]|uniref:Lupus La protein n=1 Tax=Venturia nashicola TaxID=86259 RepID=A0A4Z1PF81_9PEZI|nr:lupus La protein [Venturia nashicola]TLD38266.1 lupus La protein [Venturia nashicola]
MSDETKPIEAVEAPKVESEAPKVEAAESEVKPAVSENVAVPEQESAATGAEKTEVKSEESAEVKSEESPKVKSEESPKVKSEESPKVKSEESPKVKSEESLKVKKEDTSEKNGDLKTERTSRSQSPYSKRQRDNRNGGDWKGFQNHSKKDNIKSVYALAESDDANEIRKQVEFYFSDSNLCQDKFLFTQTGGTDNKPIPISVIHSFKRMRHFKPFSAVVAALKESKTLEVVNGDEVKRKTPLPIDKDVNFEDSAKLIEDAAMARSIYVKGFGAEVSTSQLDIEEFFQPYGPINMVKLRRDFSDNTFKGSVFVEFVNAEVMQDFMDLETKPLWKGEKELKYMTKKAYCEGKIADIKAGKIRPNEHDSERSNFRGGRGGGRGRGDRGRGRGRGGRGNNDRRDRDGGRRDRNGDDRDWKTRRDNDQRKDRKGGDRGQRSASPAKAAVDDRGVPVIHSSTEPTTTPANGVKKESSPVNDKKRSREDDAGENIESKKVKADA